MGGESPANEDKRTRWLAPPVDDENKRALFVSKASFSCQTILGVSNVVSLLALDRSKMCVPDGTFPALIMRVLVMVEVNTKHKSYAITMREVYMYCILRYVVFVVILV